MVTSLIKLVTECHSSIKFQNPRWLPILPYDSATKLLFLNYQLTTFSTALTSQNKQFVTPVWVFGWWQLILSTMKCYGYKIPPRVIFTIVGCGRWWNVPNRNIYNSTTRHLLQQDCPQQINEKKMNKRKWVNHIDGFHASLPPFPCDTRNSKFYIPFILIYYQKTSILQWKCVQKYKKSSHIIRWCHENVRWCWKFLGGVEKLKSVPF